MFDDFMDWISDQFMSDSDVEDIYDDGHDAGYDSGYSDALVDYGYDD